ncbi:MAG: hypothetical protein Q4A17_14425 [Thermoguttaceae bacterium]|nr:hypothetical protein [Thermoguttaceae bacterium]
MKVKIQINGQTYEKEIDDSGPVTINVSSGNGATNSDSFEKAFESFDKAFAESEADSADTPYTPQKNDPKAQDDPLWAKIVAFFYCCGCLFVLCLLLFLGIIVAI